ncbi:DUF6941 family protein [Sellimonas catena]|uniref:Uncharacterized protein n=1 Tax=Sellimonas catena TaxID=2994035 RepID=A0A9W6FG01_9FIRM|nr:hypothetical protein [Sellimonas catena]GLG06370.1 hypothetical protein Selli1_35440 [Sellimonas catena]
MSAIVSTFIYCLGTTNIEGKNSPINAMGVLQNLTPEFIPSTFSFSIVVGIKQIDLSSDHKLDIIFKDTEGNNLVEAKDIPISAEQLKNGDLNLPEEQRGLMLGLDLRNVILKKEGNYKTEVRLDGIILGEFDIYAKAKN